MTRKGPVRQRELRQHSDPPSGSQGTTSEAGSRKGLASLHAAFRMGEHVFKEAASRLE